jgi:hypothetical protein
MVFLLVVSFGCGGQQAQLDSQRCYARCLDSGGDEETCQQQCYRGFRPTPRPDR